MIPRGIDDGETMRNALMWLIAFVAAIALAFGVTAVANAVTTAEQGACSGCWGVIDAGGAP